MHTHNPQHRARCRLRHAPAAAPAATSMRCRRLLRYLGANTAAVLAPSSTEGASGPMEAPLPRVMAEAAALRKTWGVGRRLRSGGRGGAVFDKQGGGLGVTCWRMEGGGLTCLTPLQTYPVFKHTPHIPAAHTKMPPHPTCQ